MNAAGRTDEELIRTARSMSNVAIANKDIDGIANAWMDDILVLGSTSVQLLGAQASRSFYVSQFALRTDTLWVRTPTTVSVLPAWNVALEEGDWWGQWTELDGTVDVKGRYSAQWVRVDGKWRIQGELYVPTACVGSAYCSRPPRG